jgi:hypothetical protein
MMMIIMAMMKDATQEGRATSSLYCSCEGDKDEERRNYIEMN